MSLRNHNFFDLIIFLADQFKRKLSEREHELKEQVKGLSAEVTQLRNNSTEVQTKFDRLSDKLRTTVNERDAHKQNWEKAMSMLEQANQAVNLVKDENATLKQTLIELQSANSQKYSSPFLSTFPDKY